MGMFDGLLGGVVGAEMATVVNGLIEKHGGIQGIVAQLEQQGLGGTVRSWVGTGANLPITADQIRLRDRQRAGRQGGSVARRARGQALASAAPGHRQVDASRRRTQELKLRSHS
jgi:hypothetical protein